MAPAAKDASKRMARNAKAKDSVEKEPSVELTEEEQLEESKAVEEMMGVASTSAPADGRSKRGGQRRASQGSCTSGN